MSSTFARPISETAIQSARIEADADAEALRAALAAITTAEALAEALGPSAYRHGTAVAGEDAGALLALAADEIRGGLSLLARIEDSDLAIELRDARDEARAESRRAG